MSDAETVAAIRQAMREYYRALTDHTHPVTYTVRELVIRIETILGMEWGREQ